ncbi:MAG: helix-turn-helix domain-containing protein [Oscillospiraceae bacterium]
MKKIKMKGNDTMSFKEMSEANKHFTLLCLVNGRFNVEYYSEKDIQELIEYLIENVERRLGVKIKFQIMKEVSDNRKFCNKTREEKRKILELIKQGLNNSQIERLTGVSRRTIANIRRNST